MASHRHEHVVLGAVRPTRINIDKALEECILAADGEDGVQACMQVHDDDLEAMTNEVEPLEACILDAKSECVTCPHHLMPTASRA